MDTNSRCPHGTGNPRIVEFCDSRSNIAKAPPLATASPDSIITSNGSQPDLINFICPRLPDDGTARHSGRAV
ncbi:hypothetical protein GCM10027184_10350 [Saccharothrix stipae]